MFVNKEIYPLKLRKQINRNSSSSINSLLNSSFTIPNEKVNINKEEPSSHKCKMKEDIYDCEKTRLDTDIQIKHVSFKNPFAQIIEVYSYKNLNQITPYVSNINSPKKKRQKFYNIEKSPRCKCFNF